MKVAVIGGGASGIACAVSLKKQNKSVDVAVYEKMPRVMKKILATGNGRCNITNVYSSEEYFRGSTEFLKTAFEKYPPKENIRFFSSMGLLLREEAQGRVYPVSGQASSVVNILLSQCEGLNIRLFTDTEIDRIEKTENGFLLNGKIKADAVVISAGGSAAKSFGTDGGSFKMLKRLNIKTIRPVPALTGVIAENFPKALKGVRNICTVTLEENGKTLYTEKGEVQFNDYGLSGIPVMQFSGLAARLGFKNLFVRLDLLPDMGEASLLSFLSDIKKLYPEKSSEELVQGILPKALGNYMLLLCKIKRDCPLKNVSDEALKRLGRLIKNWKIKLAAVRDFEFAQTTSGGIDTDELCPKTLMSRKYRNLFVIGEAVNIDGLCGGHNLQWAWSSGRLCADSILKENKLVKNK